MNADERRSDAGMCHTEAQKRTPRIGNGLSPSMDTMTMVALSVTMRLMSRPLGFLLAHVIASYLSVLPPVAWLAMESDVPPAKLRTAVMVAPVLVPYALWQAIFAAPSWFVSDDRELQVDACLCFTCVSFYVPILIWTYGWLTRRRQPRAERLLAAGLCPTCQYNLTGNTSGTCPECGTVIGSGNSRGVPS